MDLLHQCDFRALLEFTGECYQIREGSFDDFLRNLVGALGRLIPATHVTYNEMLPQKSQSRNWVNTAEFASAEAAARWELHMNEHPVMRHILETDDRHAVRISDFWSPPQLHDRGLYCDFYGRYDVEDALCISVPCPPPMIIGVGWHRDQPFTGRELAMAELVRPHVRQAWEAARRASGAHRRWEFICRGLDNAPPGVIECDAEGRVQFMSALARQYLRQHFGASGNLDHRLPPGLLRWMREAAAPGRNGFPGERSPLCVETAGKRLTVHLLANDDDRLLLMEEVELPGAQPGGALQGADRELPRPVNTSSLPGNGGGHAAPDGPELEPLEEFGLSPREREVLGWVAQGKTNREIAAILNSKPGTVRKHMEHIFQKLGVETRTAAALMFQNAARHDE